MKSQNGKRWLRLVRYFLIIPVILVISDLVVLAHPNWSLDYHYEINNQTYYSDLPLNDSLIQIFHEVASKSETWPFYNADHKTDICIFQNQENYNFYRRMAFIKKTIPAYNLSLFETSLVSISRLQEIEANSYHAPRYSVFEGEINHAISHELVHDYFVAASGYLSYLTLPVWKREGLAEYLAGLEPNKSREPLDIRGNINLNDRNFSHHVREYNRWALMVEYLLDVKRLTIPELIDDNIELDSVETEFRNWVVSNEN